jgi:hypothetical protein
MVCPVRLSGELAAGVGINKWNFSGGSGGGGGGGGAPAKLKLTLQDSASTYIMNSCLPAKLEVLDSSGNMANTGAGVTVNFTGSTNADVYPNDASCISGNAASMTVNSPVSLIFVKLTGSTASTVAATSTGLDGSAASHTLTMTGGTGGNKVALVNLDSMTTMPASVTNIKPYKCTPVLFQMQDSAGKVLTTAGSSSEMFSWGASPADGNLNFYAQEDHMCLGSPVTGSSVIISSFGPNNLMRWMMVTNSSQTYSLTLSTGAGDLTSYAGSISIPAAASASSVMVWPDSRLPNYQDLPQGICVPVYVSPVSSSNDTVNAGGSGFNYTPSLSGASGGFYMNPGCTTALSGPISFAATDYRKTFYMKISSGSSYSLGSTVTSLSSPPSLNGNIQVLQWVVTPTTSPNSFQHVGTGGCELINYELRSGGGTSPYNTPTPTNFVALDGFSSGVWYDTICSAGVAETIPANSSSLTIGYRRPSAGLSTFTVSVSGMATNSVPVSFGYQVVLDRSGGATSGSSGSYCVGGFRLLTKNFLGTMISTENPSLMVSLSGGLTSPASQQPSSSCGTNLSMTPTTGFSGGVLSFDVQTPNSSSPVGNTIGISCSSPPADIFCDPTPLTISN